MNRNGIGLKYYGWSFGIELLDYTVSCAPGDTKEIDELVQLVISRIVAIENKRLPR